MAPKGFGVIGTGLWGQLHAQVFAGHPKARLLAVCDVDRDRARQVAEQFGAEDIYTDYHDMLRHPGLDAVGIATPDFAHADPAVAAAEAGKSILIEKPLATSVADAQRIARAVRRHGVRLMVDFHNRWNPPLVVARQTIADGKLGELVSAYIRFNCKVFVPTKLLSWGPHTSVLWFLGAHSVDILRWLLASDVVRVQALSRSVVLARRGMSVPDGYQSAIEFDNGVIAQMENHWIMPDSSPNVNDIKINIVGSQGSLNLDLTHNQTIERVVPAGLDYPDTRVRIDLHGRAWGLAVASIEHFIEALDTGKDFIAGLEDGLAATAILEGLLRSAEQRTPIQVQSVTSIAH